MKINLPFNRCLVIASPKKRYEILPAETVNLYREKNRQVFRRFAGNPQRREQTQFLLGLGRNRVSM